MASGQSSWEAKEGIYRDWKERREGNQISVGQEETEQLGGWLDIRGRGLGCLLTGERYVELRVFRRF